MAEINLTRTVEFATVKMWFFTEKEKVTTETVNLYKTENTRWLDKLTAEYAKEKGMALIKYEVEKKGVHLMTLPLSEYIAIAKVKEEKIIKEADVETTETVETVEQEV